MKVLIFGGAGFVGHHLSKFYLNRGDSVFITKLHNTSVEFPPEFVFDVDILDINAVIDVLNKVKPDYICNLVAVSSVTECWKNPQLAVDVNIKGCINIFESIRVAGLKSRLLMIGSSEEYGNAKNFVTEHTPLNPVNIYGATKVTSEIFASVYDRAYGLDIVSTRSYNKCGPYQPAGFVIADFCKQVALIEQGLLEPIIKVGNLNVYRDFLDIRDAVKAYALLLEKGTKGAVYNIASGKSVKIHDILMMILGKSDKKIEIFIDKDKFRPVDSDGVNIDISKVFEDVGWKPNIPLDETLENILNYWRSVV